MQPFDDFCENHSRENENGLRDDCWSAALFLFQKLSVTWFGWRVKKTPYPLFSDRLQLQGMLQSPGEGQADLSNAASLPPAPGLIAVNRY